jgi:hypothetical protein
MVELAHTGLATHAVACQLERGVRLASRDGGECVWTHSGDGRSAKHAVAPMKFCIDVFSTVAAEVRMPPIAWPTTTSQGFVLPQMLHISCLIDLILVCRNLSVDWTNWLKTSRSRWVGFAANQIFAEPWNSAQDFPIVASDSFVSSKFSIA